MPVGLDTLRFLFAENHNQIAIPYDLPPVGHIFPEVLHIAKINHRLFAVDSQHLCQNIRR